MITLQEENVCSSSAAGLGLVEKACIDMDEQYHVARLICYVIILIGSNIVKEEIYCLFCGYGGFELTGAYCADNNQ